MNKSKNSIAFNIEKAITILIIVSTLTLTLFCATSCSTSTKIHKKQVGYQKIHQYTCPAFN
jgi:hypothetical protein